MEVANTLAYYNTATITAIGQAAGINLIKLFCCKFTHAFLKAKSFHNREK